MRLSSPGGDDRAGGEIFYSHPRARERAPIRRALLTSPFDRPVTSPPTLTAITNARLVVSRARGIQGDPCSAYVWTTLARARTLRSRKSEADAECRSPLYGSPLFARCSFVPNTRPIVRTQRLENRRQCRAPGPTLRPSC